MLIEVDGYKKHIKGYSPEKSELFHVDSAKLADKDFKQALKSNKFKRVVLMAGGTASGKTEFTQFYLNHKDQLVYDGTLKNFNGFQVKISNIKKYGKNKLKVKVVYILPLDWMRAFEVFLSRERKMSSRVFFETHIKSARTVAAILGGTKCRVEIYISQFNKTYQKLDYSRLRVKRRDKTAKNLMYIAEFLETKAGELGIAL